MTRASPPVAPEALQQIQAEIANCRKSHLEMTYGQFHDETIDAADKARFGTGGLMRDLNRICTICSGLAAVMRIVSGNDVLADFHDPDDADSEPPLSRGAINSLVSMTAAVCEGMANDISRTSEAFNGRGGQA
jgi:hypothetical protein